MKNFSDVKILLYGTGAVGSLYGAKLAEAGASVSTVCRSDFNEVSADGIFIKSVYGDYHFTPVSVLKAGSEYKDKPDFIIVATKCLPEINVAEMIKDSVHPGTSIVLLQNGIDIEPAVAGIFRENEIISGLAFVCATRIAYGRIDHADFGRIVLGTYPRGISEKVKLLLELFRSVQVPAEADSDIIAARWRKLLWNAPFNPLSVLCGGADTLQMMNDEHVRELAESIMREVVQISAAHGHPVAEEFILKNIEDTLKMKPYKTSMLLDYEAHRPVEIEAILGNAIRIAELNMIPVPHMKTIYALLGILNSGNLEK
jgi:2-dehydropantoate 2-reductase